MKLIPVFNLQVLQTDNGYVVIRDDMSFEAKDEQEVLSLIKTFADARFEW